MKIIRNENLETSKNTKNDENLTRSNEIASFLKTRFSTFCAPPRPPEIPNLGRSQTAIKTNEKLWKPSIIDLQHDELINIP